MNQNCLLFAILELNMPTGADETVDPFCVYAKCVGCFCEVQRAQCPVQVKGGSLAQFSGVSPLSTGYYLTHKAAGNQLRCLSDF